MHIILHHLLIETKLGPQGGRRYRLWAVCHQICTRPGLAWYEASPCISGSMLAGNAKGCMSRIGRNEGHIVEDLQLLYMGGDIGSRAYQHMHANLAATVIWPSQFDNSGNLGNSALLHKDSTVILHHCVLLVYMLYFSRVHRAPTAVLHPHHLRP